MTILTVSQLNRQVRTKLESEMGDLCVEGELSNVSRPASGHVYFTLKDSSAQIKCVYFRNRHLSAGGINMQNGLHVVAHGALSLYEARGDYQLIVETLIEAGIGDLYQQFEHLKIKLAALGLFDIARKQDLPAIPACIGVITSGSGAALHDILTTLARRFPLARVRVYTSDVQGAQASAQLINAIHQANHDKLCDVLILARGGGSIEDLWAFNNEHLAHAIANSRLPIVAGIGHETDFTIADFVADLRAATPTAAAEAVVPDWLALSDMLCALQASLIRAISRLIQHKKLLLKHEIQKIASPGRLIATHWQTLDYLETNLYRVQGQLFAQKKQQLRIINMRLNANNPRTRLVSARLHVYDLERRLKLLMRTHLNQLIQRVAASMATLQAVSPQATLHRGYAIVSTRNQVLSNSDTVKLGDVIHVQLAHGSLVCDVQGKNNHAKKRHF